MLLAVQCLSKLDVTVYARFFCNGIGPVRNRLVNPLWVAFK